MELRVPLQRIENPVDGHIAADGCRLHSEPFTVSDQPTRLRCCLQENYAYRGAYHGTSCRFHRRRGSAGERPRAEGTAQRAFTGRQRPPRLLKTGTTSCRRRQAADGNEVARDLLKTGFDGLGYEQPARIHARQSPALPVDSAEFRHAFFMPGQPRLLPV